MYNNIAVIIPACNEPKIDKTLESIYNSNIFNIIVVVNNCTDNNLTLNIAKKYNITILEYQKLEGKKAAALNIAVDYITDNMPNIEYILQMDADTILDPLFIKNTMSAMNNPKIAALGASFVGQDIETNNLFSKFISWGQKQEFIRFHNTQLTMQTTVISGTACLLRKSVLDELNHNRGYIWQEDHIVEDFELTKALQKRGWLCMTSNKFVAYTDVMMNWEDLLKQRLRWQTGTLQVVFRDYKQDKVCKLDVMRQTLHYLLILPHILGYIYILFGLYFGFSLWPIIFTFLILSFYNIVTLKGANFKTKLVAGLVIPVEMYNFLRHIWFVKSLKMYLNKKQNKW